MNAGLFGAKDLAWIEPLLDLVERSRGEPWRVLLERVEHSTLRASPGRVNRILGALRRVMGGKASRTKVARQIRALVLGHPALNPSARAARFVAAANELGLEPAEIEPLLWGDLATERPVLLPKGRPEGQTLAAFANLERVQAAVRQAFAVRIQILDDAHELVRAAARLGLISTVTRDNSGITLAVTGPLALFHATTVYGRALAALVPLLARHERYVLEIETAHHGDEKILRFEPPFWLPATMPEARTISVTEHLARDLEALGCEVERDPAPIESGETMLYADLAVRGWRIEIVGFSTDEYLAHKRARYRAAGVPNVVLCVDRERTGALDVADALVPYRRRVDAQRVLAIVAPT